MTTIKRQFLVPRASLQLKTTPTKKLPEISLSSIKELHIFWGFLLKVFSLPTYEYLSPAWTKTSSISPGATGATAVAPKFSDTLTLFHPRGGRFCPTIAEVAPKISPWLHLCSTKSYVLPKIMQCNIFTISYVFQCKFSTYLGYIHPTTLDRSLPWRLYLLG